MEKEIHLAAIITQEDLAVYCEHKNIDPATLSGTRLRELYEYITQYILR